MLGGQKVFVMWANAAFSVYKGAGSLDSYTNALPDPIGSQFSGWETRG